MAGLAGDGRQESERVAGGCDVVGADLVRALPGGEGLRGERRRPGPGHVPAGGCR